MNNTTTTDAVYSLGQDFVDTGFCNLWTYYPYDETFAVVLPYDSICSTSTTNSVRETTFMLEGTMYFGLGFLLVVMIQSMHRHRFDWYRLIAFYLVGTLGVPLSNEWGTDAAGFNRFIGFGVLVHNMAEAAILAVIWRGTQTKQSSRGVRLLIVYFWVMIVLITLLPLHVLLWVSSFQGATLDFFLVTSFCTVAVIFKKNGKFFWIAFAASLLHILTIQPLFLGMMLGWTALSVPTVIFLTPTFMLYIVFASSDPNATLSLAQHRAIIESQQLEAKERVKIIEATTMMVQRMHTKSVNSQAQQNSAALEMGNVNSASVGHESDTGGDGDSTMKQQGIIDDSHDHGILKEETDAIDHILKEGLLNSKYVKYPKYAFKRALIIALIGSIADEILLIFSPCYLDTSFLCGSG